MYSAAWDTFVVRIKISRVILQESFQGRIQRHFGENEMTTKAKGLALGGKGPLTTRSGPKLSA